MGADAPGRTAEFVREGWTDGEAVVPGVGEGAAVLSWGPAGTLAAGAGAAEAEGIESRTTAMRTSTHKGPRLRR